MIWTMIWIILGIIVLIILMRVLFGLLPADSHLPENEIHEMPPPPQTTLCDQHFNTHDRLNCLDQKVYELDKRLSEYEVLTGERMQNLTDAMNNMTAAIQDYLEESRQADKPLLALPA